MKQEESIRKTRKKDNLVLMDVYQRKLRFLSLKEPENGFSEKQEHGKVNCVAAVCLYILFTCKKFKKGVKSAVFLSII